MVTSYVLLLAALALIAITLGLVETGDANSAGIHYLIGQEKMHEASWDHCPGGTGNPIRHKVTDDDWATFQTKYAQQLTAYPANCP